VTRDVIIVDFVSFLGNYSYQELSWLEVPQAPNLYEASINPLVPPLFSASRIDSDCPIKGTWVLIQAREVSELKSMKIGAGIRSQ
jgi:hypothetical protein